MDATTFSALTPYISYSTLVIFGIACVVIISGLTVKMPKRLLKAVVLLGLTCAFLMAIASGALYLWHHYYR